MPWRYESLIETLINESQQYHRDIVDRIRLEGQGLMASYRHSSEVSKCDRSKLTAAWVWHTHTTFGSTHRFERVLMWPDTNVYTLHIVCKQIHIHMSRNEHALLWLQQHERTRENSYTHTHTTTSVWYIYAYTSITQSRRQTGDI